MNANWSAAFVAKRVASRLLAGGFLAASLLAVSPAHADDGAWRVGQDYVIRFAHLDLGRPADRQALLRQVERSARRVCEGRGTRRWRDRCEADAIAAGMAQATPEVRAALASARMERDGVLQARN